MTSGADDSRKYVVLINEEEQYSLWLRDAPVPAGWRATGKEGSKAECLQFVDEVWVDLTPASTRGSLQ